MQLVIYLMMKIWLKLYKIPRKNLKKFLKRWRSLNISRLNSNQFVTSTKMFLREYLIFILSLLILQIFSQHINGLSSSISIYTKNPSKNQFLENKIGAKILSTNSKLISINLYVEACLKKINLFSLSWCVQKSCYLKGKSKIMNFAT